MQSVSPEGDERVEEIRAQYVPREPSEYDELRSMHDQVSRPVKTVAYVSGSIGSIVLGAGMSLVMTDIGTSIGIDKPLIPGIVIGVIGLSLMILNYPAFNRSLTIRKKQHAQEIIGLADKILSV